VPATDVSGTLASHHQRNSRHGRDVPLPLGAVYLYVAGPPVPWPVCRAPAGSEPYYTVWREIVLQPGRQYTPMPDTPHWFQAGPEGAIVSEFSTRSTDEQDGFRDPRIARMPEVAAERLTPGAPAGAPWRAICNNACLAALTSAATPMNSTDSKR